MLSRQVPSWREAIQGNQELSHHLPSSYQKSAHLFKFCLGSCSFYRC